MTKRMTKKERLLDGLKVGALAPLEIVALLAVVFAITLFLPRNLTVWMGVRPRSLEGLAGILLHPFLHHGVRHLFCNAAAIVVLGWMIALRSRKDLMSVTVASWLLGGSLLWVLGKSGTVVGGASGIVYGYLGFLLLRGLFDKRLFSIALSLICVYFFHGALLAALLEGLELPWMDGLILRLALSEIRHLDGLLEEVSRAL